MPADMMEKTSSSPVAATPASMNTTPDKPKTASEHRKVGTKLLFLTENLKHFLKIYIFGHISAPHPKATFTHESRKRYLNMNVVLFSPSVIQANYGKEKKSQDQRELGPAENSHPGCAQKRCKYKHLAVLLVINRHPNCRCQTARK